MTAHSILKQYFGYDTFRGGQESLIGAVLAGRDALGIMPTGAGKSLCFQVPALMFEGVTLVVSPLISLMKDQVNALTQSGVAAAFINSSLTERQISLALERARGGAYKLIYIAPERLLAHDFLEFARSVKVSMLTVDEAHCISQWGQDFRPSYSQIPEFIARLGERPVVSAFTATATPRVRGDIAALLELRGPLVLATGFDRPNLYFDVRRPKDKYSALADFLDGRRGKSGIVYCATRAAVDEVCGRLRLGGHAPSRYHAGLSDRERHENQDDFIYDRARVMVATNAFGMGIDKSNVSYVVHYNMPKDIESYYQEAGRAGRDGEPADCLLLYSGQDVRTNLWLIENARDAETDRGVLERERKRLREMAAYCATSDCLRGYILKYFGEDPPERCGRCGNCAADFETVDVTVEARKILSCVASMRERYGLNTVIDTLKGSKNEKVRRLGLDRLPDYGACKAPGERLRAIIGHMLSEGRLVKTDDEYPVIKLGERADGVLRGGECVYLRVNVGREQAGGTRERPGAGKREAKRVDARLFDILKELRLSIARAQGVPAFVVFSDSTLTDMCIKLPKTRDGLLEVSGVGLVKAERYGEKFLSAINGFAEASEGQGAEEERGREAAPPPGEEEPAGFDPAEVEITDEPVGVKVIADRINCVLMRLGYAKVSGALINGWLVSAGYMVLVSLGGNKTRKAPAEKGAALGITEEKRPVRGETVTLNMFSRDAQRLVVSAALDILDSKNLRP